MACVRKYKGRWIVDYCDRQGKRHRVRVQNQKDGKRRLAEISVQVENGTHRPDASSLKFEDYVPRWIENRRHDLRAGTWQTYRGQIRDYLLHPEIGLGQVKLSQFDLPIVSEYRSQLISRYRKKTGGSLSDRSLSAILSLLGTILETALREGYLAMNPVRHISKLPRSKSEAISLDIDRGEVQRAIVGARSISQDFYMMVLLSVMTGLRRGELLALRWSSIDLEDQVLHVTENFTRSGIGSPKTSAGHRTIDLAPEVVQELRKFRLLKGNPEGVVFLFAREDGTLPHPDHVSKALWARLVRQEALQGVTPRRVSSRRLTWHGLRHTYASLLIKQNAPMKYISDQMGHSSIQITMDTYGHLMPSIGKDVVRQLGQILSKDPIQALQSASRE